MHGGEHEIRIATSLRRQFQSQLSLYRRSQPVKSFLMTGTVINVGCCVDKCFVGYTKVIADIRQSIHGVAYKDIRHDFETLVLRAGVAGHKI